MRFLGLASSFLTLCLSAHFMPLTWAADLKGPIDLSSAKVLPKGVRNLRYKGAFFGANEKFGNNGQKVVLADPLFKNLTWNDIVEPRTDPTAKGALHGYLVANGFDMNEEVGRTTGDVSVDARAHIPVLAYGISERLTMAVAVPVVQYKYNVDTGFVASDNARRVDARFADEQRTYERNDLNNRMRFPVQTKAKEFGYNPLSNEEGTKLGDVKVVTKYLVGQNENFALTLQPEITAPTGDQANPDKIIDVAPGDGQWDAGLSFLTDWYPTDRISLSTSLGYIWQIEDTTSKRIPYKEDNMLTDNKDERTKRDLGDHILAQVGGKFEVLSGFNLNTGYALQVKDKDRYSGSAYESVRYQWLEANTYQRMQTVQVGAGYSTLRLFQEKIFPVPLEANLTVTKPFEGKNVTEDTIGSLEFAMFF